MHPYQPFLIAPFRTGLDTDIEPWLLPADAFTEIDNGHIHHGYIEKRAGYTLLAEMAHGQPITAATNASPAVFTIASTAAFTDGDRISLHYLAGGTWSTLNEIIYTITVQTGTTFTLTDLDGTAVDGTSLGAYTASSGRLGSFEGLRIMGIFRFLNSSNIRQALIADTQRVGIYNSTTGLIDTLDLYDLTSTLRTNHDVFTSANTDYIWSANWQSVSQVNRVYFTNGKAYQSGTPGTDGILYYDGQNPRVTQFQPSLGGSDLLYGCKLIFTIKQRLVCLYTYEYNGASTDTYPQRASWCAAQDPTNWDRTVAGGGGYVDAPTGDHIVSAQQIQDLIIVNFTDSVWMLRPVSDPALPVRWERINSFRSADSKMGTVGFDRYSLAIGLRGITATDGVETKRVDNRIEDFTASEINDGAFNRVFGLRNYDKLRTWFLYPSLTSDEADSALIYDEESGAYSTYEIPMNVLGYGSTGADLAAEDFIPASNRDWSAIDFKDETAQSFYFSEATELFLGGDRSGNVHVLDVNNTDNGSGISFNLQSAAWNPFIKEGKESQLGYVDFYVSSDVKTDMTVSFYKNDEQTPYTQQNIDCLPFLNYLASVASIVINADPTTGFTVTAPSHSLVDDDTFYFYGIDGSEWLNDIEWTVGAAVTENTFNVDTDITSYGKAIAGISQANPAVVTSTSHGFSAGDRVYITDVSGMVQVNNLSFTVANPTTNTFELQGIDSTAYTAYSANGYVHYDYLSGGKIFQHRFYGTKVWKRAYAGGIGYEHRISLENSGINEPLRIHAFKCWFKPRGRRTLG